MWKDPIVEWEYLNYLYRLPIHGSKNGIILSSYVIQKNNYKSWLRTKNHYDLDPDELLIYIYYIIIVNTQTFLNCSNLERYKADPVKCDSGSRVKESVSSTQQNAVCGYRYFFFLSVKLSRESDTIDIFFCISRVNNMAQIALVTC